MDNKIISAIYDEYLDNAFDDIKALNTDDLQAAYANLDEFEKKHNISLPEHNDIETNIINEVAGVSELKGFTNGFKLAVRLIFEVYGIAK